MTWKEPLSEYFREETLARIGLTDTSSPRVSMRQPWSNVALYVIHVAHKTDIVFAERSHTYPRGVLRGGGGEPQHFEYQLHTHKERYLGILPRTDTTGLLPFVGEGGMTLEEEERRNLRRVLSKKNRTPWYALDERFNELLDSVSVEPLDRSAILQPRGTSPDLSTLLTTKDIPARYGHIQWHDFTKALPFGRVDGKYAVHTSHASTTPSGTVTIAYGARTLVHQHNGSEPRTERSYYAGQLDEKLTMEEALEALVTTKHSTRKDVLAERVLALLRHNFQPDTSAEAMTKTREEWATT